MIKVLLLVLALSDGFEKSNRCRAHEQRCELFCNEDHPGGSLARMRCYERCRLKEQHCNRYGDDEP
jgi:hypothetical protein